MKKLSIVTGGFPLVLMVLASGCIDKNYDLSDIDSLTEIKAENLTVPVNLDPIRLESMIDLDEENPDAAIKIIGGKYCVLKSGSFSGGAYVSKVYAPAPTGLPSTSIDLAGGSEANSQRRAVGTVLGYTIPSGLMSTEFDYDVTNVDPAILSLGKLGLDPAAPVRLTILLSVPRLAELTDGVTFRDLQIELPLGLEAEYESPSGDVFIAQNGVLTIPEIKGTASEVRLALTVSQIDLTKIYGENGIEVVNGQFNYGGKIAVKGGLVLADVKDSVSSSQLQSLGTVQLKGDYTMSSFTVNTFWGAISYNVNMGYIAPVDLSDLPDFLNDPRTSLTLENPQINLEITNPVARYGLDCRSGLTITALRGKGESESQAVLPAFTVKHQDGNMATILLAPNPWAGSVYPAFNPTERVEFSTLGGILSGEGLPKELQIDLESNVLPQPVVEGKAEAFQLGQNLNVAGTYTFYTDLALVSTSRIVYAKEESGWNDEDVDAIRITEMTIDATALNTLPFGATLKGWPVVIDQFGRVSRDYTICASTMLTASEEPQPFTLRFENATNPGSPFLIEHLDGIYFEVDMEGFDGIALQPDQTITITDLRATVSGSYTKKL